MNQPRDPQVVAQVIAQKIAELEQREIGLELDIEVCEAIGNIREAQALRPGLDSLRRGLEEYRRRQSGMTGAAFTGPKAVDDPIPDARSELNFDEHRIPG